LNLLPEDLLYGTWLLRKKITKGPSCYFVAQPLMQIADITQNTNTLLLSCSDICVVAYDI